MTKKIRTGFNESARPSQRPDLQSKPMQWSNNQTTPIPQPPQVEQPVDSQEPERNPLLNANLLPGETFPLPSGGIYYTHGEVTEKVAKSGEVVIYPMVTIDEIIMKTPDKLLNGTAVTEVISRCIPDIKNPLKILGKDMDYLLIALRKVTYGPSYEIEYTHDCEGAKEHSYVVDIDAWLKSNRKLDANEAREKSKIVFPNGQVGMMMPPRYEEILKMYAFFDKLDENFKQSEQESEKEFLEYMVSLLDNVDGISDKRFIFEWAQKVPSGFIKMIGERISVLTNWGVENKTSLKCRDCNTTIDVPISLNPINFFS